MLNNPPVRSSIPISRNFNLPKASSSGFGSIPHCIFVRPIKTRFRCAYAPVALRRAMQNKSLAHSSIGTSLHGVRSTQVTKSIRSKISQAPSKYLTDLTDFRPLTSQTACFARFVLRFLVGKWFQVLFQRPHRPAFHLSLTVLVHYRSRKVFSLSR